MPSEFGKFLGIYEKIYHMIYKNFSHFFLFHKLFDLHFSQEVRLMFYHNHQCHLLSLKVNLQKIDDGPITVRD